MESPPKVLIVEDEDSVARLLEQALREADYDTTTSDNGDVALRMALDRPFDLILLDLMLPGRDGLSVCRALRSSRRDTPIMMITARDTLDDKIKGLDAGADDYIVKPFILKELLARIRALLRRTLPNEGDREVLRSGDLTLDTGAMEVRLEGRPVALSSTEFTLLEHLMRHQGKVLTREEVLQHVWQYDFNGDSNVLHVYISYLRRKLEGGEQPRRIHTVRGVGYRFGEPE